MRESPSWLKVACALLFVMPVTATFGVVTLYGTLALAAGVLRDGVPAGPMHWRGFVPLVWAMTGNVGLAGLWLWVFSGEHRSVGATRLLCAMLMLGVLAIRPFLPLREVFWFLTGHPLRQGIWPLNGWVDWVPTASAALAAVLILRLLPQCFRRQTHEHEDARAPSAGP